METLFGTNESFKGAVSVINNIPHDKFPLVLMRIIKKLDVKNEAIFSPDEETQLQGVLGVSPADLQTVLEACSFIFEQAAFFGISSDVLALQLEKSQVQIQKVSAFQQIWQSESAALIAKLKKQTFAPYALNSMDWRLHLQIAQSGQTKMKEPAALFDFAIRSNKDGKVTNLAVEFSQQELYDFYTKLEIIQEQLDNLDR